MQTQVHQQSASRGQNAKRYCRLGLLAGAAVGFLSGGIGFSGVLTTALMGGAIGLAGGAVAGNKLNPVFEKVMGLLPGGSKLLGSVAPVQALTPQKIMDLAMQRPTEQQPYQAPNTISASKIQEAMQGYQDASKGMDSGAAPLNPSTMAANGWDRATHPGSPSRQ